jgi:formamidopyrimidine-DNA glycosylase
MPELPEVETVANGVHQRIRGRWIESAWFGSKPEPFKTAASLMAEQLPGRRIDRVRRVGKHIVFDLSAARSVRARRPGAAKPGAGEDAPDAQWIVHLGMTGRLLVCEPETPLPAHTHAVLHLAAEGRSAAKELRFVDARRFGRLELVLRSPAEQVKKKATPEFGFKGPGSEPLTISPDEFVALFRGRRLAIKSALLNQKLLHGVGNIYADESLFRAAIRPKRMAGRLTSAELLRLRKSLVEVLRNAIALGGSSVSNYVDADGVEGFFQLEHRVYQRTGQPCLVCATPIRRIVLGGRSTHYCPACQR